MIFNNKKEWSRYSSIHSWLRYHHGKASKCEGKDCRKTSPNYNWAKLHGKPYEYNRENFIQLCRSCHGRYDVTSDGIERTRRAKLGRPMSKESVERRAAKQRGMKRSPEFSLKLSRLKNGKELYQFSLGGNLIRKWDYIAQASKELNISYNVLKYALNGSASNISHGYKWSYQNKLN